MNPTPKTEWPALLAFAVTFALGAWAYPQLPESVPVHWGADGQPDRYGGRLEALFLTPLVLAGAALLLLALQRFSPNERKNASVLRVARLGLGLLAAVLVAAQAFDWPVARSVLIGVGFLFVTLGNVLGKAQPSPWVGLRTPWTLSSRRAWYASQRRGAVWFTAFGALLSVAGLIVPPALLFPWVAPVGVLGGALFMVGWLTYASYLDWKRDPQPEPALTHERPA